MSQILQRPITSGRPVYLTTDSRASDIRANEAVAGDGDAQTNFPALLARLMQVSAVLATIFAAIGFVELAREALVPMIVSIGLIGFAYFFYRIVMRVIDIITGRDYAGGEDDGSLLPFAAASLLSMALLPILALVWGARTADIAEVWRLLIDGVKFGETPLGQIRSAVRDLC